MSNILNDNLLEKLFENYIKMGYSEEEAEEKAKQDFYQMVAI
tara:strand:+ start:77 stop:202 length:126 start_codon:yes stop_codon:yes gene_type:complete